MVQSKYRGHDIEIVDNEIWVFSDTKQLISENPDRLCGYCGKESTIDGHDKCLGTLDGVMNACCGHGERGEAYVQFPDGSCIRGERAIIYFQSEPPKE